MTWENSMKFRFLRPSIHFRWPVAEPAGGRLSLAVFSAAGLSGQTETPRPGKPEILPGPLQRRSVGPGCAPAWAGESYVRGPCQWRR